MKFRVIFLEKILLIFILLFGSFLFLNSCDKTEENEIFSLSTKNDKKQYIGFTNDINDTRIYFDLTWNKYNKNDEIKNLFNSNFNISGLTYNSSIDIFSFYILIPIKNETQKPETKTFNIWPKKYGDFYETSKVKSSYTFTYEIQESIPKINLKFNENFGIDDIELANGYYSANIDVVDFKDDDYSFQNLPIEIKGRGNGSWFEMPKRGYKIKLSESKQLLGLGNGTSKHWALISNFGDASHIRNSMMISATKNVLSNINFVPDMMNVELDINGEYYGLYTLIETIRDEEDRVDINATKDLENNAFLFELDSGNDGTEDYDFVKAYGSTFTIHSPDMKKFDLSDPIERENIVKKSKILKDYLNNLGNDLNKPKSASSWNEICEKINMNEYVDYYIAEHFSKNIDVGNSSQWFYKENNSDVLHVASVWDFELSFFLEPDTLLIDDFENLHELEYVNKNNFIDNALWKQSEFKTLVKNRWKETSQQFKDFFTEYLTNKLENESGIFLKDDNKWQNVTVWTSEVEKLEDWIIHRIIFFDTYFS